jgi:NADP-dependent aldehyde dehydrogenase
MLHCGIQEAYEKGVEALSSAKGVRTLSRSRVGPRSEAAEGAPAVLIVDASEFLERPLLDEVFGPVTLVVECADRTEQQRVAKTLTGQLTGTIHGTGEELAEAGDLIDVLSERVGRLVFNGFPTGVEVCPSMHHGGPYPATTDSRSTSVGTAAILRFARPICFQAAPHAILPAELRSENPLGIWRLVDGEWTRASLPSAESD